MSSSEGEADTDPEKILLSAEKWWKERYEFLEKHGCRLRPRYEPNWRPSWLEPGKDRLLCEDNYANRHRKTIDAVQLSTGKSVFLKAVKKNSGEKSIAIFLCSEDLRDDPRNHCVPILDSFEDDMESDTEFIVMPLLRVFSEPSFDTVEEAFDFVRQMLEAVAFIHEKNVAHRDLSTLNIMYSAEKVYPKGYHPASTKLSPDVQTLAPFISRTAAGGVKYFITDFGISTLFKEGSERRVLGLACQDKTVPELSDRTPYDPFPVDIYTLGNVFKEDFTDKYKNLKALIPLVVAMTKRDPTSRPTAVEALEHFERIERKQSIRAVKWKLKRTKSNPVVHIYRDIISLGPVSVAYARWLAGPILRSSVIGMKRSTSPL